MKKPKTIEDYKADMQKALKSGDPKKVMRAYKAVQRLETKPRP